MDWSKAKTYLIIAFTITNFLLIWSIASDMREVEKNDFFTKESLDNLQVLLEQKDIHLEATLPKDTKKMGMLMLRYEDINMDNYRGLFEDYGDLIEIVSGKQIRLSVRKPLEIFEKNHALADANDFIHQYGLDQDFSLRNIQEKEDSIHIIYEAQYDNMFLEGSEMELIYKKNGDFFLERTKLEVIEKSPKKTRTKTSVEAVMQASTKINPGETIDEIQLGYYYEEYSNNPLATTKTATAFPNWRIRTTSGEYYFIQAFD